MIFTGIISNEWLLTYLFSTDGVLQTSTRLRIWACNIILVALGLSILQSDRRKKVLNLIIYSLFPYFHKIFSKLFNMTNYFGKKRICLFCGLISMCIYLPWVGTPYTQDASMHLYSSYLISKGIFPIRDMYSHVTPYYYLFYSSIMSIIGFDMISARLITYLVGSIIGIFVFIIVCFVYKSKITAIITWIILQLSILYLAEASPLSAMGHSFISSFFIMLAVFILSVSLNSQKYIRVKYYLFGTFIAFSIWSRQVTLFTNMGLFLILVFNTILVFNKNTRKIMELITISTLGMIVTSLFGIYLFMVRSDTFLFSYYGSTDLLSIARDVGHTHPSMNIFSFEPYSLGDFITSFNGQTAYLLIFSLIGTMLVAFHIPFRAYRKCQIINLWIVVSFISTHIAFSRHGHNWHYYGVLAPFLAITAAPIIIYIKNSLSHRKLISIIFIAGLIHYFSHGIKFINSGIRNISSDYFFTIEQYDVSSLPDNHLKKSDFISERINKILDPGDKLLSCNSNIYTNLKILPPFNFGYWESLAEHGYTTLGDESVNRHHLFTQDQIIEMIEIQEFDVILVDSFFPGVGSGTEISRNIIKRYNESVLRNYNLHEQYGTSKIYISQKKRELERSQIEA